MKLFNFFMFGTIAIMFTFFPMYLTEQGLSKLQVGMIMAGGPFISIFSGPLWGYISDRTQNVRRTIVALLLGSLISIQAAFHLDLVYSILFAVMLVFFFFQSPLTSQGNSLILNTIEGTDRKFGEFRLWGSLGFAVVALAAGPLIVAAGMDRLWMIYSFMVIVALCSTAGMPKGNTAASVRTGFSNARYGDVFKNRTFLAFVLLGVLISVPNSVNGTFIALYIQELGGTEIAVGWSAFLAAIFEIAVFLLLDRIIRRDIRFMLVCLALVSVLFSLRWLLMSMATEPIHVLLIQMMHCITFGGYFYLGTTFTGLLVPAEFRASGQAAFALTWGGVSGIIAGFFGGWIYEALGAAAMYRINALIALCGTAGFLLLLRHARRRAAKEQAKQAAVEA
ncbi:MFS transporter [Paenibacillus thermotolerans]|uniref:MFS transporter n=1 Tax=Paenibacillus thermotolerans TaxID=3027807 RepID=UPI002368ED47|nr:MULTISPECIES: MFS transporter [unclassified Paenibacillus]